MNKLKKKETPTPEEVIEEVLEKIEPTLDQVAVSIIPKIKDDQIVYDIIKFDFSLDGICGKPTVLFTEIRESTAITRLLQAAHETLGIKTLRSKTKELRIQNGK
jgi:hypothetical protein